MTVLTGRENHLQEKSHNKPTWTLQRITIVWFLWWVDGVFWGSCWKEKTSSRWWINRWDRQGGAQKESPWTTQCLEDDPFPTPRIFSTDWCKTKGGVAEKNNVTIIETRTPKFHICSCIHLEIPKQDQYLKQFGPWHIHSTSISSGCSAGRWSATICNGLAGHTFREGAEIYDWKMDVYHVTHDAMRKKPPILGCLG